MTEHLVDDHIQFVDSDPARAELEEVLLRPVKISAAAREWFDYHGIPEDSGMLEELEEIMGKYRYDGAVEAAQKLAATGASLEVDHRLDGIPGLDGRQIVRLPGMYPFDGSYRGKPAELAQALIEELSEPGGWLWRVNQGGGTYSTRPDGAPYWDSWRPYQQLELYSMIGRAPTHFIEGNAPHSWVGLGWVERSDPEDYGTSYDDEGDEDEREYYGGTDDYDESLRVVDLDPTFGTVTDPNNDTDFLWAPGSTSDDGEMPVWDQEAMERWITYGQTLVHEYREGPRSFTETDGEMTVGQYSLRNSPRGLELRRLKGAIDTMFSASADGQYFYRIGFAAQDGVLAPFVTVQKKDGKLERCLRTPDGQMAWTKDSTINDDSRLEVHAVLEVLGGMRIEDNRDKLASLARE